MSLSVNTMSNIINTRSNKHYELKNIHDAVIKLFNRVLTLNDILMTNSICITGKK